MPTIDESVLQEANRLAQKPGKFGFVGYQANFDRKPGDWDYSLPNPGHPSVSSGQFKNR